METAREVPSGSDTATMLTRCKSALLSALRGITIRPRVRSLRLCETLPLGEKRSLMVVQFHDQRLLIGATSHSISLLQRLNQPACTAPGAKPKPAEAQEEFTD